MTQKDKRYEYLHVRLTKEEKEQLYKKKSSNQNMSKWVRDFLFQEEYLDRQLEKDVYELAYQIRKIGTNLNQIAARMNMGIYTMRDKEKLFQEIEKIQMLLKIYLQELKDNYGNNKASPTKRE